MKAKDFFQKRSTRHAGTAAALVALVLALFYLGNLIVLGISDKLGWYFHTTEPYDLTLSGKTDSIFASVGEDADIRVIFCDLPDNVRRNAQLSDVQKTAEALAARHAFLSVEYVNLWLEPQKVEAYRTNPDGSENTFSSSSVIITRGGEFLVQAAQSFYTLDSEKYVVAYNGEEVLAASVLWVAADTHPVAYFTANHGEEIPPALYRTLVCSGYRPASLDLASVADVPTDAALLVISSPLYDFQRAAAGSVYRAELDKLAAYLAGGGNLLVTLDAARVEKQPHLTGFLAGYGISPAGGELRDPAASLPGTAGAALLCEGVAGNAVADYLSLDGRRIVMNRATPLALSAVSGVAPSSLLVAPASAAYTDATGNAAPLPSTAVAADALLPGGGRLAVFGSAYVANTKVMSGENYGNKPLFYAWIASLDGRAVPGGIPAVAVDRSALENLTTGEADLFTAAVAVVLPVAILAVGLVLTRKRKAK